MQIDVDWADVPGVVQCVEILQTTICTQSLCTTEQSLLRPMKYKFKAESGAVQ